MYKDIVPPTVNISATVLSKNVIMTFPGLYRLNQAYCYIYLMVTTDNTRADIINEQFNAEKQEVFDYVFNPLGGGMVDVELDPQHYETALQDH